MGVGATKSRDTGLSSRELVLKHALDLASLEGLDRLSIGRLAGDLNLSKSGLFALFGSKERLQLAVIEAARAFYVEHIILPAQRVPAGVGRLLALMDRFLLNSEEHWLPGGCFFTPVAHEFDSRPGPIRDAIGTLIQEGNDVLARQVHIAVAKRQLRPGTEVAQIAFELQGLLFAANLHGQLGFPGAFAVARSGARKLLLCHAADENALAELFPQT
ncbi:TetR family transcriptional regulator C-terminal domain-containing protein [Amycolatopsis sp. NPDC005003]